MKQEQVQVPKHRAEEQPIDDVPEVPENVVAKAAGEFLVKLAAVV